MKLKAKCLEHPQTVLLMIALSAVLLYGTQYVKMPNGHSSSRVSPVPTTAQPSNILWKYYFYSCLLLLDVGRYTSTFVLSSLRKTPPRIIVGESWVIWDQWHDGQGVVVASCLEKTPTVTVMIKIRTSTKGRHRLAYCLLFVAVQVGSSIVADMHARTTCVPCYVPVVGC